MDKNKKVNEVMIESLNPFNDPKFKKQLLMEEKEKRVKEIENLFKKVGEFKVDDDTKREYFKLLCDLCEMKEE